ncbi:hypothetical protein [Pendulispora albinea]|uniref:Uncharacterized protein n=1 Tax=Pendulispora albinea TaxID=2741071 RepID=A0ABZ2MD07_9BACT
MRAFAIRHAVRISWAQVRRLFADRRGNSDLTTYMLLTAAGAAMVGLTVPSLFQSSDSAARTFKNQVDVLEKGANGGSSGGSGAGGGGSGWTVNVGKDGVNVSGPGGVSGSVGSGGVSVGSGGGGGGGGSSGGGKLNLTGSSQGLGQMQQSVDPQQTSLFR